MFKFVQLAIILTLKVTRASRRAKNATEFKWSNTDASKSDSNKAATSGDGMRRAERRSRERKATMHFIFCNQVTRKVKKSKYRVKPKS